MQREETEMKRLECLKIERQKIITARGGSKLSGSSSSSPLSQMRRLLEPNSGH
ncbi:hypothetical protein M569_11904 [Genlisea aurea]|uniref:Uncharacterized protein n=1 Tax=Genlisea aurea TaxID=192259 RepID=S8C7V7_9LAMI|nr:hypothetical protein M569_11904 [Genlisea aurea]